MRHEEFKDEVEVGWIGCDVRHWENARGRGAGMRLGVVECVSCTHTEAVPTHTGVRECVRASGRE